MGRVVAEDGVDAHHVGDRHEDHDEQEEEGGAVHDAGEGEWWRSVASSVSTSVVASSVPTSL